MPAAAAIVFVPISTSAACRGQAACRMAIQWSPPAGVGRIQPETIGQERGERPGRGRFDRPGRAVAAGERGGVTAWIRPFRAVLDPAGLGRRRHPRSVVGQVERRPRALDRQPAPSVQAQEPDPSPTAPTDVGPDVDLGECAWAGWGGQESRCDVLHPERDDAQPGLTLERVDLEALRDQRAERLDRDRPMGEQQVDPAHPHDPRRLSATHR